MSNQCSSWFEATKGPRLWFLKPNIFADSKVDAVVIVASLNEESKRGLSKVPKHDEPMLHSGVHHGYA